jgi:hypothetical protein
VWRLLFEELTPVEEERPLEVDEVDELDEVVSEEVVPDEVEAVLGMVAALIAVKTPTRPSAAKAAP